MAGLTKLDGGDSRPQGRATVLATSGVRPTVEVVYLDPAVTEITDATGAAVVDVQEGGPSAIVHVVEPVVVDPDDIGLGLEQLADVEDDQPAGTPLILRRGDDGIYRTEPAPSSEADPDSVLAIARGVSRDLLAAHEQEPEPHTAYDDMPSLRLLFENGLI